MKESEEQRRERKILSNKRINAVLIIVNVALFVYAIYCIITYFLN